MMRCTVPHNPRLDKEGPMADKTAKVKPVPDGYHSATPYLIVDGAAKSGEGPQPPGKRKGADVSL